MNALQRKIEVLTEFGAAKIINNTIDKLMVFQIAKYRNEMKNLAADLKQFEEKYSMSSEECYRRFNEGGLGDDADFFEWTGLYENLLLYRKRIETLEAQK